MTDRRGFTLIELLIVMGIIMTVFMVSLPVFGPMMQSRSLDNATQVLSHTFMRARSLAITNNAVYYVTFDTRDNQKNMIFILDKPPLRSFFANEDAVGANVADGVTMLPAGVRLVGMTNEMYRPNGFPTMLAGTSVAYRNGVCMYINELRKTTYPLDDAPVLTSNIYNISLYYAFSPLGYAVRNYSYSVGLSTIDEYMYEKSPRGHFWYEAKNGIVEKETQRDFLEDEFIIIGDDDFDKATATQFNFRVLTMNLVTGSVQTYHSHYRQ